MDYYVFATKAEADACVKHINVDKGWYPIVGNVCSVPAPKNQQTVRWVDEPTELKSGEWSVPKLPDDRFDYMKVAVAVADKSELLATYGKDVRTLTQEDFPDVVDDPEAGR